MLTPPRPRRKILSHMINYKRRKHARVRMGNVLPPLLILTLSTRGFRGHSATFQLNPRKSATFSRFVRRPRETLESVSSCTRFSGFLTISSFGLNRLSSKLVSMFFGIVPMFVLKDFVSDCFVAQICANYGAHAHFGANMRDEAILNKILLYKHWNYPKEHAYQF